MQGVYKITINNKSYIGKDMKIDSNKRFNQHLKILNDGATNTEIGNHFNLNSGYVSLIRHKKRYSDWWDTISYSKISSSGKCRIKYEEFVDIIENLKIPNKDMATKYNVDRSIISNIRNKKGYKEYYQRYNQVQRPTKSSDSISDELSSVGPSGGQ